MRFKLTEIRGVVCKGKGDARFFTQLDWVQQQFLDKMGFAPYPGTLNIQVEKSSVHSRFRGRLGITIEPQAEGYCSAECYKVRVNHKTYAMWIVPDVPNYPENQIELVAPVSLRETLNLKDGDALILEIEGDA